MVLYPLPEIPFLLLCATLAGAGDFVEIVLWGNERLDFLRRFQPNTYGIPSHDTRCDIIAAIDPDLFKTCLLPWVADFHSDIPDAIAIDGKTSQRNHARGEGRLAPHTVSAWATRQLLVLGQEAVAERSNEIIAIPAPLQRLDLNGHWSPSTRRAPQPAIAQAILDGGGNYVLQLKKNWPATYAEVDKVLAAPPASLALQRHQTVDGEHGRIET